MAGHMGIGKLMDYQFNNYTVDEWREKAEQALKGKTVESLCSSTYEEIVLKPLYSADDKKNPGFAGKPDYRRGIYQNGYQEKPWRIAQKIVAISPEELREKLKDAAANGQTAIALEVGPEFTAAHGEVIGHFAKSHPFAIKTTTGIDSVLEKLEKKAGQGVLSGYIAFDPILLYEKEVNHEDWAESIKTAAVREPVLRTVMVDTGVYHVRGANAVQELAAAAATGVSYIESLLDAGMDIDDIVDKFVFNFQIGSEFFMEVAKLRAARIIWDKIAEVYGASEVKRKMVIAAETSKFTLTLFDSHVNLLRTGNEAFAAVLGGVQYLHVDTYDSLTGATPFSERIARNIQLILKEEAHLDKVADPAGGSWFIEELTEQLAEKAWELFCKIDHHGGMVASLQSGWIQTEIERTLNNRLIDSKNRKRSIIGTNVYANLAEETPKGMPVLNIPIPTRLSVPFEELRIKAKELETAGVNTEFGLICLGDIRDHKPRADFVEGFLSPGGIRTVRSGAMFTVEDALTFIEEKGIPNFCICSSNELYEEVGLEIASQLKKKHPDINLYLAGQPGNSQEWEAAGIHDFIHAKSNCYQFINSILNGLEVPGNAQ
ncbi:methylmalonyl-CoA mutase family protein [Bacillus sp. FJAT-18017]|uniref:methylmalonyl-CoA mutase family protein n=1 Tax=Bacillus sp. FJAT-18017 TaxID=1705566 RepID=UPI0006AE0AE8|nr:methylmalonyl-CoA mutase family protein [Bacillus sp. FJAT-18017]